MSTDSFFEAFFPPEFWASVKSHPYPTSDHSMFADTPVFSYLVERFRPATIVEIGSWHGHSANFMADICRAVDLRSRILCIDTFLGSVEHWHIPELREELHRESGRPTIYDRFLGNTIAHGNDGIVFPLPLDSINAAFLLKVFEFQADLIFVDGAHDYTSVTSDLAGFFPLLSPRGVMFGDDYQHEPLANAVHDFAVAQHLPVFVSSRKWIYATPVVVSSLFPEGYALRESRLGWVHP